ncbi:UNVERIFIED_CONTAM: hypothetical protein NCL1_15358 [Trichonephila clavipes]
MTTNSKLESKHSLLLQASLTSRQEATDVCGGLVEAQKANDSENGMKNRWHALLKTVNDEFFMCITPLFSRTTFEALVAEPYSPNRMMFHSGGTQALVEIANDRGMKTIQREKERSPLIFKIKNPCEKLFSNTIGDR